jgi:hypothetical protein
MTKNERPPPNSETYAFFISATVSELAKKDWLGDVKAFPEIQTDLDALKERVAEMQQDTAKFHEAFNVFERTRNSALLKKTLQPFATKLSRCYAQIIQVMGKISFDIDARYGAQYLHNIARPSDQEETPATPEEIKEAHAMLRPEREMFDSIRDFLGKDTIPEDDDNRMSFIKQWIEKDATHVEKMDGTLLRDRKGFEEAAMKTRRPIEAKLFTLDILLANIVGIAQSGGEHFATLRAGLQPDPDGRAGGKSFS